MCYPVRLQGKGERGCCCRRWQLRAQQLCGCLGNPARTGCRAGLGRNRHRCAEGAWPSEAGAQEALGRLWGGVRWASLCCPNCCLESEIRAVLVTGLLVTQIEIPGKMLDPEV